MNSYQQMLGLTMLLNARVRAWIDYATVKDGKPYVKYGCWLSQNHSIRFVPGKGCVPMERAP